MTALQHQICRTLANDFQVPEKHPIVTATLSALTAVARRDAAAGVRRPAGATADTLATWWSIIRKAHAQHVS